MKNIEYNENFGEEVRNLPIGNDCNYEQPCCDENRSMPGSDIEDNNLTKIYNILKWEYDDCDIENENLLQFAIQLNEYVFDKKYCLNEIICLVSNFEEYMRENGKTIDIGRHCLIFDSIIDCLEIDEENAKRLYESFLEFRDCNTFWRLMDAYTQFLTEEQRKKVLFIAKEEFDKFVWEDYV